MEALVPDDERNEVRDGLPPSTMTISDPSPNAITVTWEGLKTSFVDFLTKGCVEREHEFYLKFKSWFVQKCNSRKFGKRKYKLIFLLADRVLCRGDADLIYKACESYKRDAEDRENPALLVLHSPGGYAGPAYLIGKMLHEYFSSVDIAIPRKAKSAATLLSCAANRIHMGSLSELGPIDPQTDDGPALGLKAAIEQLARLYIAHPGAKELFVEYMRRRIKPVSIGHYERIVDSAVQYAVRLLRYSRVDGDEKGNLEIAKRLAFDYKDHGFVIDKKESQEIFGSDIVKHNTPEYDFANDIYLDFYALERLAAEQGFSLSFVGSLYQKPQIYKIKKEGM